MINFPNQLRMIFLHPPPPTPTCKKFLLLQISNLSCNNLGKGSKQASKKFTKGSIGKREVRSNCLAWHNIWLPLPSLIPL